MATTNGNLPPKEKINSTTEYFNNFFDERYLTSPDIENAVVAFFQSVTGSEESGRLLAATIIYTALSRDIQPMSLVDEFRKLPSGRIIEEKTSIDATQIISTYTNMQGILADLNTHPVGQLFYIPTTDVFYRIVTTNNGNKRLVGVNGYRAERISLATYVQDPTSEQSNLSLQSYDYYFISTQTEKDELTPYLTVLLNSNRVGTSLLGLSNSPQVNKYVQRSIIA